MNSRAADVRVKVPLFVTLLLTAGVDATAVPDEAAKTGMMPSGNVPIMIASTVRTEMIFFFMSCPF